VSRNLSIAARVVAPAVALVGLAAVLAVPTPAAADDCTARIAEAWAKVAAAPAYRQVVVMATQGQRMEAVVIGETVYVQVGDGWQKLDLKPGGRQAFAARFVSGAPTVSCAVVGEEAIDGVATVLHDFTRAPIAGLETAPVRQKLWIRKSDGLVRRLVGDKATVDVFYEGVSPPK
jgi:hypothetical protein